MKTTQTIAFALLVTLGCGPKPDLNINEVKLSSSEELSLKIGVLADSQIQTPNFSKTKTLLSQNSKNANFVTKVAIRPPIQNALALHSLIEIFNKIESKKPDMIFYLGDALNNGCNEELDIFKRFIEKTATSKTPFFMVIGNHDYLGAGNYATPRLRERLCAEKPLSKSDMLKFIYQVNVNNFHKLTSSNSNWTIKSNISSLEQIDKDCGNIEEKMDTKETCFLSIIIENHPAKTSISLVDSSDYSSYKTYRTNDGYENPLLDRFPALRNVLNYGLTGLKGAISDTQTNWLASNSSPDINFKIIAAHYCDFSVFSRYANKIGKFMINKQNPISNLYLSAHTHSKEPVANQPIVIEKTTTYLNIETGSTTDYKNHGSIITVEKGGIRIEKLNLIENESECKDSISKIKNELSKSEYALCENSCPVNIWSKIGLAKSYLKIKDLNTFTCIGNNIEKITSNITDLDKSCLMNKASYFESTEIDLVSIFEKEKEKIYTY